MLNSNEVPQADMLHDVIKLVEFVQHNPGSTDSMIAGYINKGKRQGRYYRHAAQLLGLIVNDNNSANLTTEGSYFLGQNSSDRTILIRKKVMNLKAFQLVLELIRRTTNCGERDIEKLLQNEGLTLTTGDRRAKTLIHWLIELNLIRQSGECLFVV